MAGLGRNSQLSGGSYGRVRKREVVMAGLGRETDVARLGRAGKPPTPQ